MSRPHRLDRRSAHMRNAAARAAIGIAVILALIGTAMLAYPAGTDRYQQHLQRKLSARFSTPEVREAYRLRRTTVGQGLTRLQIPAIDVDVVVVQGTSPSALRTGAGHYPATPLPGEAGNVAVAGHRTTYGRPFSDLDRLRPGDAVNLVTPLGRYTYRVSQPPFVVGKNDWSPIAPTAGHVLTLTTCHPKHSARQRLIVRAQLVDPPPQGA